MVVVHAPAERTARFWERLALPFVAACSADGAAHRAFGLRRGRLAEILGPRLWAPALRALLKGRGAGLPQGDVFVLPGAFVCERDGRLSWVRYGAHAADHVRADALIAALAVAAPSA